LSSCQRKFKDRVEDEGRHQVIKVVSGFIHLIAFTDNTSQYVKDLLRHEIILSIKLKTIDAVLEYLQTEVLKQFWISVAYIFERADSH
jgi:hypothetical protein